MKPSARKTARPGTPRITPLGLFTATLAILLFVGHDAQAQTAATGNPGQQTTKGRRLVVEVPPDGTQVRLPLNPTERTVLRSRAVVRMLSGNPRGAVTKQLGDHRIDVWPFAATWMESDPPITPVALGGNFSVEIEGRTVVFQLFEPDDLDEVVTMVLMRPISGEVIALRRELEEAKDDVARAEAARALARQEAIDAARAREAAEAAEAKANQEAEKARVEARASRARAQREVVKANAEAAKATKEAQEARAAAAKAQADAEAARAEAAAAREREKQAIEAARRQAEAAEQTLHQSLVAVARDIGGEQVQRLIPAQDAKYVRQGRVQMEYRSGDWKHGYFVVDTQVRAESGRPIALGNAQATTKGGRALETRVVHPSAPENPVDGVITTVRPGTAERITFAIKVPPDVSTDDLTLTLTPQGSQKPLNFMVPRYDDAAVALLLPVSDAEEQRRRWATHIVAGPRFAIGGCSLTSGIAGDEDVEFTRCTSIGAFAMKGLYEAGGWSLLAVGAEATYEWSGEAQFDRDPTDISRQADLLRILVHGDVRLSRGKSVPYVRLGVGVQITNYEGAGREASEMFTAGGGLEHRFGDHISVAIGGAFVANDSLRSFHGDIRLGYRWGATLAKGLIAPSN